MPQHHLLTAIVAATMAVLALRGNTRAAPANTINDAPVDRMILLNKKAFEDIQAQHLQAAHYWLQEALVIAETASLETDEMTARTYIHLAVIALLGPKDRDQAIRYFLLALKINPNITITPGLETPALKSAYLKAREEAGLPPNPDMILVPAGDATTALGDEDDKQLTADTGAEPKRVPSVDEPDPPATVPSPLYCVLPLDLIPAKSAVVRCLTQKQPRKSTATLHYRPEQSGDRFVAQPMNRSPKGWLMAVIPGGVVHGKAIDYYVKAEIPGASSFYLGHPEAPRSFLIRPVSSDEGGDVDEPDVYRELHGERRSHPKGRPAGSLWLAVAGGTGIAYHGREDVDSGAVHPQDGSPVAVRSGFSPAGWFSVQPEIGYQWTRRFAVSVVARYQYAGRDGSAPPAVLTSALAGFVRGEMLLAARKRLQTGASIGVGYGRPFLAVVDKSCGSKNEQTSCLLNYRDTVHGGPFALTAGLGATYFLWHGLGVFANLQTILTVPKPTALAELSLGVSYHIATASPGSNRIDEDSGYNLAPDLQ